jgi:C4-dicarboxylate transporter DctM subunit
MPELKSKTPEGTATERSLPPLAAALLLVREKGYAPLLWLWTAFWNLVGVTIQGVVFVLVMVVSFALVLIRQAWRIFDWLWLWVEKIFLVVGMLTMTILVFIVALDRWFEFIDLQWFWATKLAMFIMIWVGFVGASYATKKREHLTIDVAGRILSPASAAVARFFTHIIAAVFCFVLAKFAWELVMESREFGDREGVLPIPTWMIQIIMPITLVVMGGRFIEAIGRQSKEDEELAEEGKRPPPIALPWRQAAKGGFKDILIAGIFPGLLIAGALVWWLGDSPGWLILICALVLLIMGTPLFVLIGIAVFMCLGFLGEGFFVNIPVDMFDAVKKEVLLAIPFFILAGGVMTAGSIADRLIGFARRATSWMPGGLLVTTIIACLLFAAISGSAPVTVIAIGTIMYPALVKEKYGEDLSLGLVTTAGTLGILIPPSIPMIVYAIMAPVGGKALSIRELFIAGVIPGLLVALILAAYCVFEMDKERFYDRYVPTESLGTAMKGGLPSIALIGIVFGGIYAGWFTVTEAAAVAVLFALAVEFGIYREMKIREVPKVFLDSAWMLGAIFMLIVLSIAFNKFLTEEQIPMAAAEWLQGSVETRVGFLLLTNVFLILLGCLMDIMSATLIVAPLLAPIAASYGVDPIHFGLIFIVNLSIGYITPPIGLNLFVASSVFERPVTQVIKASWPYAVIMLIALALVTYVPWLSLALLDR